MSQSLFHFAEETTRPRAGEVVTDLARFTEHVCCEALECEHVQPCMAQPIDPEARCLRADEERRQSSPVPCSLFPVPLPHGLAAEIDDVCRTNARLTPELRVGLAENVARKLAHARRRRTPGDAAEQARLDAILSMVRRFRSMPKPARFAMLQRADRLFEQSAKRRINLKSTRDASLSFALAITLADTT